MEFKLIYLTLFLPYSSNEDPKVALLFIILGLVFMHNGVVPEGMFITLSFNTVQ